MNILSSSKQIFEALMDKYKHDNKDKERFKKDQDSLLQEAWVEHNLTNQIKMALEQIGQINADGTYITAVQIRVNPEVVQYFPGVIKKLHCNAEACDNTGTLFNLTKVRIEL